MWRLRRFLRKIPLILEGTKWKRAVRVGPFSSFPSFSKGVAAVASSGPPKNPGVSAVLSFFFTGLGQIYNGQLAKGLVFMAVGFLNILLAFILIGFVTGPVFWIYGMYDAYKNAEKFNRGEGLDWGV